MVRHGVGTFVNGPERYEGDWESDQMHGKGAYQFASGCRYEGEFAHNLFHGAGVYQSTDGATYSGQWQFSRMHGDGAYVDKDGVEWRGRFFNGKYDNGRVFHTLR
uniref:MORN repeat-containing protein 5 n=1 Tax=Globisporangium ultimum (strain ATCC 200006 / CBS 805.95 / DAOM BR144) TaxID=431595 RepID=K3WM15_GLOUD